MIEFELKGLLENLQFLSQPGNFYFPQFYLEKIWSLWKYFSATVISTCLFIIVYTLRNSTFLRDCYFDVIIEFLRYRAARRGKIEKEWMAIKEKLSSESFFDYKQAIIEADKFLEKILETLGYQGDTVEEKLIKDDKTLISNYNELKEARKVFKDIIEDPNYFLDKKRAEKIIKVYQQALTELGAI